MKKLNATIKVIALSLVCNVLSAQQNWEWAKGFGGNDFIESANSVVVDKKGNSYITGTIKSDVQFDNNVVLTAKSQDPFIAKYNNQGAFMWAKIIYMDINGFAGGGGIALDALGDIYITGSFRGTANFGNNITLTTGPQNVDGFVAKFDNNGVAFWARQMGNSGPLNNVGGASIAVDSDGGCYVTGAFSGKALFGNVLLNCTGNVQNAYVAKYDKSGNAMWAFKAGATGFSQGHDQAASIAVDNLGNCFFTGFFDSQNAAFGPYTLHCNTFNSESDFFIACVYQKSGQYKWATQAINPPNGYDNSSIGTGVASDGVGGCFATGWFMGSPYFNATPLIVSGFPLLKTTDVFVVRYDSKGVLLDKRQEGGDGEEIATAISYNPDSKSVVVCGYFIGKDCVFDNNEVVLNPSADSYNNFITKYTEHLDFEFVTRTTMLPAANPAFLHTIAQGPYDPVSNYQSIYVGGTSPSANDLFFNKSLNSNLGLNLKSINPVGNGFVAKLSFKGNIIDYSKPLSSIHSEVNASHVYPNPATNQFNVTIPVTINANVYITISTLSGTIIKQMNEFAGKGIFNKTIDISTLSAGNYFVKVSTPSENYTEKLTIVR